MEKTLKLGVVLLCALVVTGMGCSRQSSAQEESLAESLNSKDAKPRKLGVLLVSHGSRSRRWRETLLSVEKDVRQDVLALDKVERITSAFMEYTEPSIATRLEEFDRDGITDVIIVPLLLTVSSHSFDDIPTICGQQENVVALERLRAEGIRVFKPQANVHMTALLDFTEILSSNILRRVRALSKHPADEGVLLVGYGSADYEEEWSKLLDDRMGTLLRKEMGVPECTHCWCGHIAHYDPGVTHRAIEDLLTRRKRVLVVPVLVAVDEMFQEGIIQKGVDMVADQSRVRYVPDSILPDAGVRQWVVDATRTVHRNILGHAER